MCSTAPATERAKVVVGQDQPRPMTMRVTHVFRRDGGAWPQVLRHAASRLETTAPPAVLQWAGVRMQSR